VDSSGAIAAATGIISSGTIRFTGLTASQPVFTDGSQNLTSSGTVSANQGGTGITSYTIGDLLYASGATAISKLADVATGNALISGGVGAAPSWGKIGLTTHVSGTLAVGNGGTGATSLTGVLKGNGTSAISAMTGVANYVARWTDANTLGTGVMIDTGSAVGVGASSPSARVHVIHTGEQLRLGYDGSNYAAFTVESGGSLTLVPTGNLILDPSGE